MQSYTIAEAKRQFEKLANEVVENGEPVKLELDDGRSVVMLNRENYERISHVDGDLEGKADGKQ